MTIYHGLLSNIQAWFVYVNFLSGYEKDAGANAGHSMHAYPPYPTPVRPGRLQHDFE